MGNCQAIDAAALVIQHPNGRIERLYWPVTASEVMRMNPGHYVSLIIPLPSSSVSDEDKQPDHQKTVRFTRVKLLRPSDTLSLGHAYRLVTSQEVMKVLRAKKSAKTKRLHQESVHENLQTVQEKLIDSGAETQRDKENTNQVSIYLSTFKRIAKGILLTQSEFETCTGFLSFISIYPFSHTYISMHLMLVRLKIFR
ncbi:D-ribose-binding periplasmic protein [Citrus sinensis]|uniref:D-ribose-binding periplasmic protein n=3 Tax=Citrus TaxID=2706 RepID=A0ACB8LJ91_CITSI|nr:D-ribose-binding periplasmic protein [Citrus sinensis]KDO36910.1 hypothetical protein CISIN_1g029249mg [Citrus sinensis]